MAKTQSLIRKISLSIFLLLSIGCGKMDAVHPDIPYVDYEFDPYLAQYKLDKLHYLGTDEVKPIEMIFRSTIDTMEANAVCWRQGDGSLLITMDPWFWFHATDDDRTAIFYHELGHCDLGIWNHATTNTIMNEYGLAGVTFAADRDFYLHTLFIERR